MFFNMALSVAFPKTAPRMTPPIRPTNPKSGTIIFGVPLILKGPSANIAPVQTHSTTVEGKIIMVTICARIIQRNQMKKGRRNT